MTDATRKADNTGKPNAFFDFFFLRPVPTVIWILLLGVFGVVGFNSMIKESLPDLEIPEFSIETTWEGATPAMVEKEITQPIEKELQGVRGVKKIYSASRYGISSVAVSFQAECRQSESMQLVQRHVALAAAHLPKAAERPRVEASSVNDLPVATIALFGNVGQAELEALAESTKRKLQRIHGVRRINMTGARRSVVRVQLLPQRLKAYGLPATLVRECIVNHGADAPWGRFEHTGLQFSMKMDGAYTSLETLRQLVITRLPGDRLVRLQDVAQVRMGQTREKTRASLSWGGEFVPVISLDVLKISGTDTMGLVRALESELRSLSAGVDWPQGVSWRLLGNQAEAIQVELDRGVSNGWQAMLAVFVVLFIFLSWREALVAALLVPLTLSGTVAVLWVLGYTFNMLVIVGMILALGLLVDDFILIMEGMHEGIFIRQLGFVESVRRTIRTYALPSFSGSITTILVLAPIAFVGGEDGKFIRVIPVTAAVCLVMSYLVSVLLGPSLSRLFLGTGKKKFSPGAVDRFSQKMEKKLADFLGRVILKSRKRALAWVMCALGLFLLSLVAASELRDTLYPKEDGRTLGITVELEADATLKDADRAGQRIGAILRGKSYLEHVVRVVGAKDAYSFSSIYDYLGQAEAVNRVGFACYFTPGKQRDKLLHAYVEPLRTELEAALASEAGARVFMNPAIGGSSNEDAVQIEISGEELSRLRGIAQDVRMLLERIPGVVDIRDSIGRAGTELRFRPMPEALDYYQISQSDMAGQMLAYMEEEKLAKYRRPGTQDDLDIRLETLWSKGTEKEGIFRDFEELAQLSIIDGKGRAVPLWSLAEPVISSSDTVIPRKEGTRSITVLAKLNGAYLSEVLENMRPQMEKLKQGWPAGYDYNFAGEKDEKKTYENMLIAFCAAVLLVYAVLSLLFDSLLYPGIILSTVLFSLVGVFFGFMLCGIPFSFSASIGIVALVGIVVNDAIILVETMRTHSRSGKDVFSAAKLGAADRLRPVVSTTVTNFAGLTPLALSDPGWAPLCQAIIFGEVTATLGAVLLIPALYVLFSRGERKKCTKNGDQAQTLLRGRQI